MIEFNPAEVDILRTQWNRIIHYQNECFGLKLFLKLLELHPEYLHLFGFSLDEDYHNMEKLQAHGINVIYMLNMLFDNIDDLDLLDELLHKLIRLHVMRGIEKSWFDDIVQPFDHVLEDFHSKVQFEHMNILRKAFMFIKNRIQELYEENVTEVLLDRSDVSDK